MKPWGHVFTTPPMGVFGKISSPSGQIIGFEEGVICNAVGKILTSLRHGIWSKRLHTTLWSRNLPPRKWSCYFLEDLTSK